MDGFTQVAATEEIQPGSMKSKRINNVAVLICNVNGKFYALADECTHDFAPISTGDLDKDEIICPRHHARFNVIDGSVKAPPAVVPVETYEVKIENDIIFVKVD